MLVNIVPNLTLFMNKLNNVKCLILQFILLMNDKFFHGQIKLKISLLSLLTPLPA